MRIALIGILVAAVLASAATAQDQPRETDRLTRIVQRIVAGDEVDAEIAVEQYVTAVTRPIAEAIEKLDKTKDVTPRLRLQQLMQRLAAETRFAAFKADLAGRDRALVEAFARGYPELTRQLFDDNYRTRLAAIAQVPLEPNSGAGVLLAARVNDTDADVAVAALDAARQLADPVVARNIAEFVRVVTGVMRDGFYGPSPEEQMLAKTVGKVLVLKALTVLEAAQQREHAPIVADAIDYFAQTKYWDKFDRATALWALQKIATRAQEPTFAKFIGDENIVELHRVDEQTRLTQFVGDIALLAILRLREQDPAAYGFVIPEDAPRKAGFAEPAQRSAAAQRVRALLASPATQPAQP